MATKEQSSLNKKDIQGLLDGQTKSVKELLNNQTTVILNAVDEKITKEISGVRMDIVEFAMSDIAILRGRTSQ